jgi:uncharacterized protein
MKTGKFYFPGLTLRAKNIPSSLTSQQSALIRCIDAMCKAIPVRRVVLFGSHVRGQARKDSDVDLCIVSDQASHQLEAARLLRRSMRDIRPKPAFSLIPITPRRLEEKRRNGDHFFATVMKEGVSLVEEDRLK